MKKIETAALPTKYINNVTGLFGEKGRLWLDKLPDLVDRICADWQLEIEKVFPNLSFNFVAACRSGNGEKYVLKVGVPEEDSPIVYEKNALDIFGGQGAVKVIRFDEPRCALLLERAVSGKTLAEVCGDDFERAVEIALDVFIRLPRQVREKEKFIDLQTWIDGLERAEKARFVPEKVAKARNFFAGLIGPPDKKVLLHGDIHFDNILSAGREPFLVIDPKGLVGEIGYEIAVFLNDLAGWTDHLSDRKTILNLAVESFAKAFNMKDIDLRKWAFSFAVLSAWWNMEDFGETDEKTLNLADIWEV